jgi:hypothetical protein
MKRRKTEIEENKERRERNRGRREGMAEVKTRKEVSKEA